MDDPEQHGLHEMDPRIATQLDEARRLLFEDSYVPEGTEDSDAFDRKAGKLKPRERAMMAFNNLTALLPGTWGDGTPKELKDLRDQHLVSDFGEAAQELGIDMVRVAQLNHGEVHSHPRGDENDSVLELYQYVFPVIEKLAREKGYEVYY